jgi:putative aminopeptidase FrvX
MFDNLKKLTQISGVSGFEELVSKEIISQIKDYCEVSVDNLGNVIAYKKGKTVSKNKVMVAAHMDEVGFIITGVTSDGMLLFTTVGGIESSVVIGRSVNVADKLAGVIGTKAMHMQSPKERETVVEIDKLYIDIGATDKEDALKHISLGCFGSFVGEYSEFGNNLIKAKAIDDRLGCAVLIELIKSEIEYDTYFAFCTQEEVGLRGSKVASYSINPDVALVIEATTASDISGVSDAKKVCKLNSGAVVPFMDKSTIYDKTLCQLAFSLAQKNGIPIQTKTMVAGGNDAGAISLSRGGVRTICISVPCRYIHSPFCVISKDDAKSVLTLSKLVLQELYYI